MFKIGFKKIDFAETAIMQVFFGWIYFVRTLHICL